jgi:hypothetical protein
MPMRFSHQPVAAENAIDKATCFFIALVLLKAQASFRSPRASLLKIANWHCAIELLRTFLLVAPDGFRGNRADYEK